METKEIIQFFQLFPGVKVEAVAATGIKISSVYFLGYILYETSKGAIDISNVFKSTTETVFELEELEVKYDKGGITPIMILSTLFNAELLAHLITKIDTTAVF